MMSDAVAITMEQLTKVFGRREKKRIVAVNHVSLEIKTEQVYGFLRPNGAAFYDFLTARRNLEVLARTANRYDSERIEMLLAQVGLTAYLLREQDITT